MTTCNIAHRLAAAADAHPRRAAVFAPSGRDEHGRPRHVHLTFRQLDDDSTDLARGLLAGGLSRGDRVVLMVPPSPELFALVFAVFKAGLVPVLVDPGLGVARLRACLEEAEPVGFLGIPKAHAARIALGWAKRTLRTRVTVGRFRPWGGLGLDDVRAAGRAATDLPAIADTRADDDAAILFTSGSTGVPKGAVATHGVFERQVELLRETYAIEPGEVDLPTFPLFALFDPALGMTAVLPDMDPTRPGRVDARMIVDTIEAFGVTNMFGSPALLRRVAEWGAPRGVTLPSLRRVISAGAPMPTDVLERFTSMLPSGTQVFTPYGATEALPVASIGSDEILDDTAARTARGDGVCVGHPVPGSDVAICAIDDAPIARWDDATWLPDGSIGEIVVSGRVVTQRYHGREQATRLAKIERDDGRRAHRMGDVGWIEPGTGRLWFCGRKAHRVRVGDGADDVLFTVPVEGVFNAHAEVARTALVGVARPGEPAPPVDDPHGAPLEPVLCVELRADATSSRAAIAEQLHGLGAAHAHTRDVTTLLFHDGFPVDVRHNAKIFREALAVWAARELGRAVPADRRRAGAGVTTR